MTTLRLHDRHTIHQQVHSEQIENVIDHVTSRLMVVPLSHRSNRQYLLEE